MQSSASMFGTGHGAGVSANLGTARSHPKRLPARSLGPMGFRRSGSLACTTSLASAPLRWAFSTCSPVLCPFQRCHARRVTVSLWRVPEVHISPSRRYIVLRQLGGGLGIFVVSASLSNPLVTVNGKAVPKRVRSLSGLGGPVATAQWLVEFDVGAEMSPPSPPFSNFHLKSGSVCTRSGSGWAVSCSFMTKWRSIQMNGQYHD